MPDAVTLRLPYLPPYDWTQVHRFLARRAIAGIESVTSGAYVRTVRAGRRHALVRVEPVAAAHELALDIRGADSADIPALTSTVRRMFDLSADPGQIANTFQRDPRLHRLVARRPGLRIPGTWDPFESGVRAIMGQQVSVAAGVTLLTRLVERIGERVFPTPEALAQCSLEDFGIPRARAAALQSFARAVRDGAVDFNDPGERVMRALVDLPGVGPWTAGYVALRGLSDPDGFPAGDLILRQQASTNGSALTPRELNTRAQAWRPFRGYAVMHLWEASAA
ncbi:MAG TPA: AlkA N-terminal domain-containing protein [Steroidobacteraceae bacterium]|jgi:AraC family transcriptional regulator of adaptative response / DNA-3-methyladenine glycosylase II